MYVDECSNVDDYINLPKSVIMNFPALIYILTYYEWLFVHNDELRFRDCAFNEIDSVEIILPSTNFVWIMSQGENTTQNSFGGVSETVNQVCCTDFYAWVRSGLWWQMTINATFLKSQTGMHFCFKFVCHSFYRVYLIEMLLPYTSILISKCFDISQRGCLCKS